MLDTDNTTEFILCWGYSKIRYRKKHIFCSIQLPLKGDCVYACKDQGEIQIAVRVQTASFLERFKCSLETHKCDK